MIESLSPPTYMRSSVREEFGEVKIDIPPTGMKGAHYFQLMAPLVFISFILLFFIRPMFSGKEFQQENFIFIAFIGVFFILLPLLVTLLSVLSKARKTYHITASRLLLRVEEKGLFRSKATEIPTDKLEDYELTSAPKGLPQGFIKTPDGRLEIEKKAFQGQVEDPESKDYQTGRDIYRPGPKMSAVISTLASLSSSGGILAGSDTTTVTFGAGLAFEELQYIFTVSKKALTE